MNSRHLIIVLLVTQWITACMSQSSPIATSVETETKTPIPTMVEQRTPNPTTTTQIEPTQPQNTPEPVATETPMSSETPIEVTAESEPTEVIVSFSQDVLPILQKSCTRCHGSSRKEEGLDLRSYAAVMAGSRNGPVVVPGDANNSPLVELVVTGKMPKRGTKLTPEQVQILIDWVNQGAMNN